MDTLDLLREETKRAFELADAPFQIANLSSTFIAMGEDYYKMPA